ncbi:DsbE family thiol:disulfide interchange protein [Candidatus Pelagibacter sp.]|nr:DsbE family thiol:disulfide interchange protein [Candidatus Pelagibacter sp.]|tara:strand:+ start:1184 stop:1702 length:519 start_codon:yes stop_codon:yes gene_type:complete
MKLRLSFILIFITIIFVFLIFFKSLYEDKVYIPKQLNNKIENISAKEFYSDDNMELKNLFEDHEYILINIWASWCLPCRQEHPYITKISKFDNLKVIGLNYKDKKNNAQNFLDELGNPYDIILKDLDGTKSIFLGAFGVPESFLVDKELNLLKKYIGPIDSESTIEVKKLLK